MKKLFPLFLMAMFLCWSVAAADVTPSKSSADVSTSNVADIVIEEIEIDVEGVTGNQIINNIDPYGPVDVAPLTSIRPELPIITDYHDSLLCFTLSDTIDTQFLGVEYDGTNFWVTGGNSGVDPNILYKLDNAGNVVAQYNQTSAGWGWRDLAWDGQYLYGSDDTVVDQIDPATGLPTGVTIPGPQSVCRGLAYNPANDHFYTANWGSTIDEFDRSGTVHNNFPNTKSIYGLAWDTLSADGPWLWVFSQDGTPAVEISQYDVSIGNYTGVSFQSDLPTGYTDAMAGGACFTEWSGDEAMFVLGQGTPTDFVYGYDMYPLAPDTVLGACCNDNTGTCVDSTLEAQCPTGTPGVRWEANTLCSNLQPPCGTVFGACCDDQGNCTQTDSASCPGLWMADTPCDPNPCPTTPPCTLVCPPNGILEGEPPCGPGYVDNYNGGCNSDPPVFSSYTLGDTVCGKSGNYDAGSRDTDWYILNVTGDAMLFFYGIAEFDLQLLVIEEYDCIVSPNIIASIVIPACSVGVVSTPVVAGNYFLWAGPADFFGTACESDYQIWTELGAAPTGACCVGAECVATNTISECNALQGNWYIGETCPEFQCPILVDCQGAIWDNGLPTGFARASQCDAVYPFAAGVADDFVFSGSDPVTLEYVVAWFDHWNHDPLATPLDYDGINVTIYANNTGTTPPSPGGKPTDPPDSTCPHEELIPNGIVYTAQLSQGSFGYVDDGMAWRLMMPVSVTLDAGVIYWLEVQPIFPFADHGQAGWVNTDSCQMECAPQIFELLGTLVWTTMDDFVDMAFCLLAAGGGACDYIAGDVNAWPSAGYNGLDITYGVNFFKGGPAPLCPIGSCSIPPCDAFYYCGDVNNSCSYNGLDITYGVNYFKGGPGPMPCDQCPPGP